MSVMTKDEQELQEALVIVRKKKLKKRIILIAVVSVAVIAILSVSFGCGYHSANKDAQKDVEVAQAEAADWKDKYEALVEVPVVLDPVTPEIVQKVLSEHISEISELATAEYVYTNAARYTDTAHIIKMLDWMTEKSFVMKWDGTIKAGVDLKSLKVSIEDKVITVSMPRAQILSYEVDQESVEVLDEKNNTFNPITVEDIAKFNKETQKDIEKRAEKNGLVEKAQKNAETIIANLITTSIENIEEYKIQFVIVDKQE